MTRSPSFRVGLLAGFVAFLTGASTAAFAAIAITKTGPGGVKLGQNVAYTLTVQNQNATGAATVDDPTPPGLTFVSMAGGGCTSVGTPGTFPCSLGILRPTEVRSIVATFRVPPGYSGANPIVNTATVTTTDGGNATSSASTAIVRVAGFFPLPPCRVADTRAASGVPLVGRPWWRGPPAPFRCGGSAAFPTTRAPSPST